MKNENRMKNAIWDVIFYGVLFCIVLCAFLIKGRESTGPRMLGGFSSFVVLSSSMEREIPKGSLVITRHVDPEELQIGDDITYMANETTTITHRIIGIEENYLDTGERAFQTQGIMNKTPDSDLVPAVNVVGKVIFHNKTLGSITEYGSENWPLMLFFLFVIILFTKAVKVIMAKE